MAVLQEAVANMNSVDSIEPFIEALEAGATVSPESLEVKYGENYIPEGWSVNGEQAIQDI